MRELLANLIKHVPVVQWLYRTLGSAALRLLGLFVRTQDDLVLLSSYSGRRFSDSPRVLYEAMKADPRFSSMRFVWALEHPSEFADCGAETVRPDTPRYFLTALRAKIWITNVNIERGLSFKKGQTVYLNTWHGTGPKKGGNAVRGRRDYDFSTVDILTCDGEYLKQIMLRWFGATEESILLCGRPREDALLTEGEEMRRRMRNRLGLSERQKLILYMPTWREGGKPSSLSWAEHLRERYADCVVAYRGHHLTKEKPAADAELIDLSGVEDVNECYAAADLLISDYSSAFFDYGLSGKPMLCYAWDYDEYRTQYGLFMDLEKAFPGGVIRTEAELSAAIPGALTDAHAQACAAFTKRYVSRGGNATRACLDALSDKLKEKRGRL